MIKRGLDHVRWDGVLLQENKIKEEDFDVMTRRFYRRNFEWVRALGASGGLGVL